MQAADLLVVAWALGMFVSDMSTRRIPNLLSLGAAACALVFLVVTGKAVLGGEWQSVLLGLALGLALTLPAYLMRWLGGGDVKLILAIGCLGGLHAVLVSFVVAGFLAGATAIAWLALQPYYGRSIGVKRWLPFGAALSVGLIAAVGFKA